MIFTIVPYLIIVVDIRAIREFYPGVRASELAATWYPRDRGALVEQVCGLEVWHTLFHDHANPQDLAFIVIGNELCGQHLDNDISMLLLRV